jgi:ABC-type branched-subunit amino acid transport system substrate-binding protein
MGLAGSILIDLQIVSSSYKAAARYHFLMVVLLHYLSNSAVFPENYSMTSTFKKLFIASAVVLSATSFMATSAYAAGWGAIAADEVIGEKDPYYGVGGGDAKGEAEKMR